jgi:hypothetical protein
MSAFKQRSDSRLDNGRITIVSQFLSVPGVIDPNVEQKSYAIPRGFVCQTALILPRAMKQLPVPRDRKRWLRKRQWLLHVADTREGGRAWRQARDETGDRERRSSENHSFAGGYL